ncbi:MAG: ABC transporter ATP-binding protein [Deltaproteobacteria bacterium]|nr:ABC transporter ATP-binding protein [Deltaproteobacteria bacterium]MBW2070751.1 ABC transporter ATP-binding protein [Deltaproteobacteria bacterium]
MNGQHQTLLEVDKVDKHFDGLQALSEVSFSLHSGEIIALIGPNGAGKTTLLNLISGVYTPSQGEIFFAGRTISGLKPYQVAALGISRTFQSVQVFQEMTALENVLVGLHSRLHSGFLKGMLHWITERREERRARAAALKTLTRLDIEHLADRPANTLSLLEQRCLEIARSIVSAPRLLLLDEPVAGLNIRETEEMAERIKALSHQGLSVLLVEHDMNLVMSIAQRVIVLHHGVKIGDGTPEAVQADPTIQKAYLGGQTHSV